MSSFDWIEGSLKGLDDSARIVERVEDTVISLESGTRVLHPRRRNIHRIEALSNCAFMDIISPPYSDPERPCTYYSMKSVGDTSVLAPDATLGQSFDVLAIPYEGPLASVIE